ncbi:DNA-3-methyladenine glycosylase [Parafrigoribacterium mesophilum]|uniref:DNA-3-methyladenine glycosylase n=1 Tax=Parafrigoribacterium mesophilum TaxID=433646 RepID=UPI0031FD1160
MLDRTRLLGRSLDVAPLLLGSVLTCTTEEGSVSLRITEIEAYHGSDDPGSHAFRGKTKRNAVMFGEPGHLYTYFTYGMHTCANVVCSPEGTASGLLLRGGEIIDGLELARSRRLTAKRDADLARGPARLTVALGITLADGGADLATSHIRLDLCGGSLPFATGPRTGLSGPGGGDDFPWRYWLPGEPSVSPYKRHSAKKRA